MLVMLAFAVLGLTYALMTQPIRRAHDVQPARPESVSVPVLLRLALGAYILFLVYAVVRAWTRRETSPAGAAEVRPWPYTLPIVAALGLILVVLVLKGSRDNRPEPEPFPGLLPGEAAFSAEPETLGYLPADTPVVGVVGMVKGLAEGPGGAAQGQPLLLALMPGWDAVERATGLRLADVSNGVLGVTGDEPASAKLILIVRTHRDFDPAAGPARRHLKRTGEHGGKPAYSFTFRNRECLLWRADRKTLVLIAGSQGVTTADLDAVPPRARTGASKMPVPVRDLFRERPLAPGTPLWVAGRLPQRGAPAWLGSLPVTEETRQALAGVQTFRVGLQVQPQPRWTGEFQAQSPEAAEGLVKFLRRARFQKLVEKVFRDPKTNWVTAQGPLDLQALLSLFAPAREPRNG